MVVHLVLCVAFQSVVVRQRHKVLQDILVQEVLIGIRIVFQSNQVQDLQSQADIQFSELKTKQVGQSFLEVSDEAVNVDDFIVVFEGFQHDAAVFGGDIVDCLAQVDWVETVLPPKFKQVLSETKGRTQVVQARWLHLVQFLAKRLPDSFSSEIVVDTA